MAILDRAELERSPLADLHTIANELGVEGYRALRRDELIDALLKQGGGDAGAGAGNGAPAEDEAEPARRPRSRSRGGRGRRPRGGPPAGDDDAAEAGPRTDDAAEAGAAAGEDAHPGEAEDGAESSDEQRGGVLDVLPNGSGFMRPDPFVHSRDDVYVSPAQIRRCELRAGDEIGGPVRAPRRSERYPSLVRVESINDGPADPPPERRRFEDGTPIFASERLPAPEELGAAPFGRGSRVAVGGPPGSGITTLLRRIAGELAKVDELDLTVVLAGVRPEEVTEWRREESLRVVGGAFDRPVDEQAQAAEIAVERGKRRAESGGHAAVVIDSLDALPPATARRVFGAARCLEEGGSLTVIASTGLAAEPQRQATTQIVLEADGGDAPRLAPASGTLQAERLS